MRVCYAAHRLMAASTKRKKMPQHSSCSCDILNSLAYLLVFVFVLDKHVVAASGSCVVSNVDFTELEKYGPWEATNDNWNVTYKINICGALHVPVAGSSTAHCHGDTSICMITDNKQAISVGNYTHTNITSQVNEKDGELTIVKQGDICTGVANAVHTTFLMMKCGKTMGSPKVLDYVMCTTYIEWRTSAMCKNGPDTHSEVPCYVNDHTLKEKFDLNPLIKNSGGYLVEASEGWQFYINVCRDIKPDTGTATSGCIQGSGACRFKNSTYIDMGRPHGKLQKTVSGNLMLQYSSNTSVDGCTVKPTTTIEFICPKAGGSEDPLLELDFNCQYKVIWKTEHACGESAITSHKSCRLTKEDRNIDIDLTPLRHSVGSDRPYEVYIAPYRYFINVCGELGLECPDDQHVQDVTVCQTKSDDSNYGMILGKTTHQLLRYVDGELTLTYMDGNKCHHNGFQRTTIITFHCNQSAANLGKGLPVFNREDDCTYLFDWDTKYACLDHPVTQECRADYKGKRIDLSPLVRQSGKNWNVLEGGDTKNHLKLFYINVCNDLLKTGQAARCKPDSSVCLIDDAGVHSLGQYTTNPVFIPKTNSVRIKYMNGDICSGTKRTYSIITFICQPGDLESGPVFLRHSPDKCIYEFEWHTAAACVLAEKMGTNCKVYDDDLGINFDLNRLTKPHGQFYNITGKDYDYLLNICDGVTGTRCDRNGRKTPNPGVCQVKHGGTDSDAFNTGQANSTIKYFDGMIKVVYRNGDPYNTNPPVYRRTEIAMLCDHQAGAGVPKFVEEANSTYAFTWNSIYACPNQPVECTATDPNTGKQYDLSSLGRTDADGNWEIVDDTDPNNKVKFYINVCRPLTEVKVGTGCSPFAGVCATKITNGVEAIDDVRTNLGEVRSGPLAQGDGRLIMKYVSHKQDCTDAGVKKNFTTTIHFVCKKGTLSKGPNRPIKIGNCGYSILWETEAACPITDSEGSSSENCVIKDRNSDYTFNLQPLERKGSTDYYEVSGPNGKTLRLNVCNGISPTNCGNIEGKNSSVCEVYSNGSMPGLAMVNQKLDYSEDGRLMLSYDGKRDLVSGKRTQVIILFLCRQEIPLGEPTFNKFEENMYYYDFLTSLACPPQQVDCLVQDSKGTMYDLSSLAKKDSNWDVIDTRGSHSDLKYYINVCRPINTIQGTSCPGGPVGGCQVNKDGHSYNMGYIQSKPVVSGNGTLTLLYKNGDVCHRGKPTQTHRSTRINFLCSTVERNPVFEVETETCEYIFTWQTPAACPLQRETGTDCRVKEPNYNYLFDLNPLKKVGSNYEVMIGQYKYLLNVCGPVSSADGSCSSGVGSCQTKPSDRAFHFNAGKSSSVLVYDAGEITLTYSSGDTCHNKKYNRSTVITFVCDQSKDGSQGPNFLNETSDCIYLFEWPTKLACTPFKQEQCAITHDGRQYDLSKLSLMDSNYEEDNYLHKKKYIFNVCRSLVSQKGQTCPFNAAACLIDYTDSNPKTRYHNIGEVNENQILFDNNRLELHYTNGELCSDNKTRTSTRIILHCDQHALDTRPTGHYKVGCEHRFVWITAGACPMKSDTGNTKSGNCSVVNPNTGYVFDLSSLKSVTGYEVDDLKGHLYHINVCDTVKGTACTNTQTGACQKEQSGALRSFNVGNANDKLHYDDGYLFLNYSGGDKCHNGVYERNIIISFVCSQTAGNGQPQFIAESDSCTYQMVWHTSLACETVVRCSVDMKNYSVDLSPLIKTSGYHPAIPRTSHVPANSSFYINVCRPLNPIYGTLCPPGSSACMISPGQNPVSLGQSHASPYFDKVTNLITIKYDHGSKCDSDPTKNYTTKIVFVCKEGRSLGQPLLELVTNCQYTFEWDTHVVCPKGGAVVKNTSDCTFTDPATRAVYNFTSLRRSDPYEVADNGNKYLINICGSVGSLAGCQGSSVCKKVNSTGGFGYGKTANEAFVQTADQLKLIYDRGDSCSDNTMSKGVINFMCDAEEYPGRPEPLYTGPCDAVFLWKTRVACSAVADQCSLAHGGHLYDLSILSSQTTGWNLTDAQGNSYWINICQGVHNGPDPMKCPDTAGACRKTPQGEVDSLGVVTTQKLYMDKDGKTIVLEYSNGDSACAHKQRRSDNSFATTIIKFECGNTVGGPKYVPKTKNTNSCVFEFSWKSRVACQVIRKKIQEVNGQLTDPESGGVISLEKLNNLNTVTIDDYNSYEIDLGGTSTQCGPGSAVCKIDKTKGTNTPVGTTGKKQYYLEDDMFEVVFSTSTPCDKDSSKVISSTLQLHCNTQQGKPVFIDETRDCTYLFIWETPVACLKPVVVVPLPLDVDAGTKTGSPSGGTKPGTVGAIVAVFLSAIIICVLLIVFHKKERRAAFATKVRSLMRKDDTSYTYSALPNSDLNNLEDEELLHSVSADDLGLQGSVATDNDEVNILDNSSSEPVRSYHDDSDEDILA